MQWTPLALSTPIAQHVFGGRRIPDRLGRAGLPEGRIAETWECSDVDGKGAAVQGGPLAGRSLRELVERHPDELVGRGWRGPHFPVLTKFIDGHGDAARASARHRRGGADARRPAERQNGSVAHSGGWHRRDRACGAEGGGGPWRAALRGALFAQEFDKVMRRIPVRSGETIYVPGGTLHSFGPDRLICEIEQTSNIQHPAARHALDHGGRFARAPGRAAAEH